MSKVVFLSFADSHMKTTLERIGKEAKESSFFDEIRLRTESDFSTKYWHRFKDWYLNNKRGYGYWLWKPYFIKKELESLDEGDILVYLDAGCCINRNGKKNLSRYISLLKESASGIVAFNTSGTVSQYCKGDLLYAFDCYDNPLILEKPMIMAGLLLIEKRELSLSLIDLWYAIMHSNLSFIDDSPSKMPNNQLFIENRHDQSIFTLLLTIRGGCILLEESEVQAFPSNGIWPPSERDWRKLKKQPFLAKRNRTGKNESHSFFMNFIWDCQNCTSQIVSTIRVLGGRIIRILLKKNK